MRAFVAPISFPSSVEQFVGMLAKYRTPEYPDALVQQLKAAIGAMLEIVAPFRCEPGDFVFSTLKDLAGGLAKYEMQPHSDAPLTDLEVIVRNRVIDWTAPDLQVQVGDFVFWKMTPDAHKRAAKVKEELNQSDLQNVPQDLIRYFSTEQIRSALSRVMPVVEKYSGTIFALGVVIRAPEFDLTDLPRHFGGSIYALIGGITAIENGITQPELDGLGLDTEIERYHSWLRLKSTEGFTRLLSEFLKRETTRDR
jgi:hypothetical protein